MSSDSFLRTWWFRLTLVTAIPFSIWRISDAEDSHAYTVEVIIKLVIIALLSVVYFLILKVLQICRKSNTRKPPKVRDPSCQYGLLRPKQPFEWIQNGHSEYLKTQSADRSVYTVLRTVEKYWIFQLEMHYLRLLTTVHQHPSNVDQRIQIPPKLLRMFLIRHLRTALDWFYDDDVVQSDEARIMICIDSESLFKALDIDCNSEAMEVALERNVVIHLGALPDLKRPISACIRIGRHIFNADSPEKSTKWAKDRKRFQKEMDSKLGLNEVLMTEIVQREESSNDGYDGYVMEGLSSNVAVLMEDDVLWTPSTEMGILPGTVRGFLIDLMEKKKNQNSMDGVRKKYGDIPKGIKFERPLFADILKWKGMVIMSTSRLVAPIDTLYIDIEEEEMLKIMREDEKEGVLGLEKSDEFGCGYRKLEFVRSDGRSDILENLRVFVRDHMKSHSIYVGSVFRESK